MNPSMPPTRLTEVIAFDSAWFEMLEYARLEVLERLTVNKSELSVIVRVSMLTQVPLATYCW